MQENGSIPPLLSVKCSTWTENTIRNLLFFFDVAPKLLLLTELCLLLKRFTI
jgi:hypothetical protein